jgi:TetR/AcrR family transcriptional regulator, tetracycline repressor protein
MATKKAKSKTTKTRPPEDSGLNRETIVATALQLIDQNGLESFSLRGVAKSLGVYPTAVYWYVNSKEKLLAEAIALAFQPEELPDPTADWRDDLRKLFHRWRQAIRRHPNLAPAVATQLSSNTDVQFELVERILNDLSRAGFEGKALVGAYNSVVASLVGFVAQEFASLPRDDFGGFQAIVKDRLLTVNPNVYPILSSNVPMLANHAFILRWQNGADAPLDESFEFYIDVVVGGLSAALALSRPRTLHSATSQ